MAFAHKIKDTTMRTSVILLTALIVLLIVHSQNTYAGQKAFYVSLNGNDSWSGMLPEPDTGKTDGPFASFEKARDAVRLFKKAHQVPQDSIIVYIRGGMYHSTETFELNEEDSGTENSPVIWRSYPGEFVRINGGKKIGGFKPVSDRKVLERLDMTVHERVFRTDLKAQGIVDYGKIRQSGMGHPVRVAPIELFFNDRPMTISRYPNEGWLEVEDVPQFGDTVKDITPGVPTPPRKAPGNHFGRFRYGGDRPSRWKSFDDIWMFGFWVYDWADMYQDIKRINIQKREIYPAEPYHRYGYRKGQRYYYLNILEEIDSPCEWYLDRGKGILYFYPPSSLEEGVAFVSMLQDSIMWSLNNTSHVTVQGMTFEMTRGDALHIKGGTKNRIAGCTVRNTGNRGIIINGGTENGILSCDIYNTGDDAAMIDGGDRKTLTPARNYAVNNHIHHYSRINRTYRSSVRLNGVGNRVSHNYIHNAPHVGLHYSGNEHIMEYNDIHSIAQETGDVPAMGTSHDWSFQGNIIRYNYFHHIHGPGHLGCMTIYCDLPAGGTWIYGNVFNDLDWGFFTNSGRNIIIENNIFIKCNPAVGFATWLNPEIFKPGGSWRIYERLEEMDVTQPPYYLLYPDLVNIYRDGDPAIPRYNKIRRNISCGGTFFQFRSADLNFEILAITDNLIADPVPLEWRQKDRSLKKYKFGNAEMMEKYNQYGNIVIDGDPGFIDLENENFRLKKDSPAWKLGFVDIPFERIGLYIDEYRTFLPE